MVDAPATEEKKPQTVPIDDDNDVDDSDEEGPPEIAAANGQFHVVLSVLSTIPNVTMPRKLASYYWKIFA
jgi:hypothetical protein